jgi:hypothetical protein
MRQVVLRPVCSTPRPGSAVGLGEAEGYSFHPISVRSDDASACNTPADAISLSRITNDRLAEKALRTTLLAAEGAAFADPIEGLKALFVPVRLFLNR